MWCGGPFLRAYLKIGEDVDLLVAIKDYSNITYHEDLGFFEIQTGDHLFHEVYIKEDVDLLVAIKDLGFFEMHTGDDDSKEVYIKPEKSSKKHQQPFWTKDYRRK